MRYLFPYVMTALLLLFAAGCAKEPTAIQLNPTSLTLTEGESAGISAKVLPEDARYTDISWTSSNAKVATVSSGRVTAVSAGSATITASTEGVSASASVTVKAKVIPVTGVSLDKTELSLTEGDTQTLKATVAPDNATDKSVTWSSSAPAVATVDASGKVTAVAPGTATITVKTTDGGKTATCALTVRSKTVAVTGVSLDKTEMTLTVGETATLKVTVTPDNATDKSVVWSSQYPEIASVDADGKVTALVPGDTQITVRTNDGGKTATCKLTVKPIAVSGVTVEPRAVTVKEGKSARLTATVSPAEASQEVEWASMDGNVATVSADGVVTGVKEGTTRVFARSKAFPDKQAYCEVTVEPDDSLKGIALDAAVIDLTIGGTRTLNVIYDPPYAANKNVFWKSSDESVAIVKDGTVTGLKAGGAIITVTSEEGGHTAKCTVNVSDVSGAVVYSLGGIKLSMNGAPDGRDHAFDKEKFEFKGVYQIAAGKSTLFSMEWYYTGRSQYWLCKDRKPIIDITEYYGYSTVNMEARGDLACILTQTAVGNSNFAVIFVKPDGKVISIPITGSFKYLSCSDLAVAPDGTAYVAACIKDAFNDEYLALYKVNTDGSVAETFLEPSSPSEIDVAVSESGDVYVFAAAYVAGGSQVGHLFKNGTLYQTLGSSSYNLRLALHCIGNDVYAAAEDYVNRTVTIYKNGSVHQTVSVEQDFYLTNTDPNRPLWVTASGDVYFSVWAANKSFFRLYKNGKILYTSSDHSFNPICVTEPK